MYFEYNGRRRDNPPRPPQRPFLSVVLTPFYPLHCQTTERSSIARMPLEPTPRNKFSLPFSTLFHSFYAPAAGHSTIHVFRPPRPFPSSPLTPSLGVPLMSDRPGRARPTRLAFANAEGHLSTPLLLPSGFVGRVLAPTWNPRCSGLIPVRSVACTPCAATHYRGSGYPWACLAVFPNPRSSVGCSFAAFGPTALFPPVGGPSTKHPP